MTDPLGIYLHIPFCAGKCNYCDFYSVKPHNSDIELYVHSLCSEIERKGLDVSRPVDTIYIGGGTPSLLSRSALHELLNAIRRTFRILDNCEITCEVNPGDNSFIPYAAELGVNRISLGVQSANEEELRLLGRRHTFADAEAAVKCARKHGIHNISADIMIGLPNSSITTLENSLKRITELETVHLSAYILKPESGTPMFLSGTVLPDDDAVSEQYLYMCDYFESRGFNHYEISNFAKDGFESRHNNKYWLDKEYLGFGPGAHSFFNGRRYYYPADTKRFMSEGITNDDGAGGTSEEYIMLNLRLSRGLVFSEFRQRFGFDIKKDVTEHIALLEKHGLCRCEDERIFLTNQGMLVSNAIIADITVYLRSIYENL